MGPFHGCSPSGRDWSPWVPVSCQQTCSSLGSSCHGDMGLSEACFSTGFPQGHNLLWASTCSCLDPCTPRADIGCSSTAASPLSSPGAAGEALLWHWSISSLSFCTDLGVWGVVPFIYCCSSAIAAVQIFLLLCNSDAPKALPPSLMGLDWASGVSSTGGASDSFSQKAPLYPLLQKLCHTNPTQQQRNGISNRGITGDCDDSCIDPDSMPPMLRLLNWTPKRKMKGTVPNTASCV